MPYKDKNSAAAKESRKKANKRYFIKNRRKYYDYQNSYKKKNRKKYSELPESTLVKLRICVSNYSKKHHAEIKEKFLTQTRNLDDMYIVRQLYKDGLDRNISRAHPEIIQAKRINLLLKRKIKTHERTN